MYYVYILKSQKDGKLYIGLTADWRSRLDEHQNGKVKSTKHRRPFELLFYEAYNEKSIAQRREKYLKSSDGHNDMKKRFS